MRYLHSMLRIKNIEQSLNFFCETLGFIEVRRVENEAGRFTLVFLAAPGDLEQAKQEKSPLIELTYNWPKSDDSTSEDYSIGRSFGHLAFEVKDIYETCQALMDRGVVIHRPPKDGYMAFIKTPDGISIELLQSGKPLETKEPWKSMPNSGTW